MYRICIRICIYPYIFFSLISFLTKFLNFVPILFLCPYTNINFSALYKFI